MFFVAQNCWSQTANIVEGCFPLTVQFTAPGGYPTHYWDFKDGASSTQQNPSNTFISAGSFVVEFHETPTGPIVGTITIDVYPKPVPEFSTDVTMGCAPLTVNFTDTTVLNSGITITGFSWVFGDGGTATGSPANHTFGLEGNYYVSLELITNLASCNVTKIYPDLISLTNPPFTTFATNPSPASSCTAPLIVSFTNNSTGSGAPLTYDWNFGNGNTSTLTSPLPETYSTNGSYQITLISTDTNGCSSTSIVNVGVGEPIANFQIADTLCINVPNTFFNLSPVASNSWNFGAGAIPATSNQINPIVMFTTPGLHSITLTINGPCPDDTTITIFVEDPTAQFTASPTYSCSDSMLVTFTPIMTNAAFYSWHFGNGDSSNVMMPTDTFWVEDTTIYSQNGPNVVNNYFSDTLTITTYAGCTATYIHVDTIHEPNAVMMPNIVEGCLPVQVTFSDSSVSNEPIVNWEWHYGDGSSVSAGNNSPVTHAYNSMGQYHAYLIITNSAGCTDTSYQIEINVGDVIAPNFSADVTTVCPGDPIQFTDLTLPPIVDSVDAWHYTTEGSRMFHCFQDPNPTWAFYDETGAQNVTLTVGFNGCYSSVTMVGLINVQGPIAEMNYFCTCDQPYIVDFVDSSHSATNILWDFGDGDTSTVANPTHTYLATGDYQVILTAFNPGTGCPISYDTSTVKIRDIQANFGSDSLLCQNTPEPFDASSSQDVYAACSRGYSWYFSDPGTRPITSETPLDTIEFPVTGMNEITLVVTDVNGCKDTSNAFVDVYSINADFTMDKDTICLSSLVTFTDLSTSDTTITSWYWEFGDDSTYTGQDTVHNYLGSTFNINPIDQDTVRVFVTVTNAVGCVAKDSVDIFVYTPVSNITVSDNTICSGTTINFTSTDYTIHGSNLNFNWDFDDTNTSTNQNPSNTYTSGGTYFVNLIYQEQSTGCIDSSTLVVFVQDFPIAGFTSLSDTINFICPNDNVLFTDTSLVSSPSATYFWDFGNGNTSIFPNPGTAYPNSGTFTVELIVNIPTPYGCADTTSQTYIVKGPAGNFFTDLMGDTICRLETVTFNIFDTIAVDTFYWDFGDGIAGNGVSPITHQYTFTPPSGQTIAKLIMTNSDGSCPLTVDTVINIYEVIADYDRNFNDVDTALCFQIYPFTNNSINADTWYWDFGDGNTSTAQHPMTHSYTSPGVYQVLIGVQNSILTCTDTLTKEIILHPIPDVAALGDTICEGTNGNLNVENPNGNWSYWWDSGTPITIVNDSTPNANSQPLFTTNYMAHVTDSNNCVNSFLTTIVVINPISLMDFDTIIGMGDTVYLPLYLNASLYDFTWTPEDGLSCLTCAPPYVVPLVDVEYHLVVTDIPRGCFTNEADYEVKVHPETFVTIPTTFTPNGDGINDVIFLKGWGIKEVLEFKIYNRWGELVFETDSKYIGWNGFYKEVLQNNDVYVYKVQVLTFLDEVQALEGHINLMR